MEAKENYDPASAALLAAGTQSKCFFLDTNSPACSYDAVNRNLMSLGCMFPVSSVDGSGRPITTNSTGYTLFDGATKVFAPGASITQNNGFTAFSPYILAKNLDTGVVTSYPTYDATKTVPANVGSTWIYPSNTGSGYTHASLTFTGGGGTGMAGVALVDAGGGGFIVDVQITNWGTGYTSTPAITVTGDGTGAAVAPAGYNTPSDGSYRWIGANFTNYPFGGANGPNLVNPRNGDFWASAESCELYQYRAADNYAQVIAPALQPSSFSSAFNAAIPIPRGVDATWVYCINNNNHYNGNSLNLVPASITSEETTAVRKLTYVSWYTTPFLYDIGVRLTFGADGNIYLLSLGKNADPNHSFHWRLTKFVPPALGSYGSNAAGSMTDLTASLWNTSGPNAVGLNYNGNFYNGVGEHLFSLVRLPATNQVAAVLKFPKECNTVSSTDYTNTKFSCLYVTLGTTPAYDYHDGFVTGYMDADWLSVGTIPTTGYAVIDCRETNNYLEQSDYVYSGAEYTDRWFVFLCYPIVGGVVVTTNDYMAVLVKYRFVSGAPPVLLAAPNVLTDPQWDANYPAYQSAISSQYVVANSLAYGSKLNFSDEYAYLYPDPGLYDPTTQSFWFSGNTFPERSPHAWDVSANAMFYLDSAFTARAAYNVTGGVNYQQGQVTPPFLRLSFGGATPPPPYSGAYQVMMHVRIGAKSRHQ